jgi:hypothetical protein
MGVSSIGLACRKAVQLNPAGGGRVLQKNGPGLGPCPSPPRPLHPPPASQVRLGLTLSPRYK